MSLCREEYYALWSELYSASVIKQILGINFLKWSFSILKLILFLQKNPYKDIVSTLNMISVLFIWLAM